MIKVGVLYGGFSPEYEISLRSAATIMQHLDANQFEIIPIHITKNSEWIIYDSSVFSKNNNLKKIVIYKHFPPQLPCDIVFSTLHGFLGEDGAMQGLLDILNMPYVGAGVLSSALGMDKGLTKQLVQSQNIIEVIPSIQLYQYQWYRKKEHFLEKIQSYLKYPVFVKPMCSGSSIGITHVTQPFKIEEAIAYAFRYSSSILIERALIGISEIEVALLENAEEGKKPLVTLPGEIITSHHFYSYQAKYFSQEGTSLGIPALLTMVQTQYIQAIAIKIFQLLQIEGMARIDFFLERKTNKFYFNEVNTLPGFTEISMYPKLWEASGKSISDLLTELITLGMKRHTRFAALKEQYRKT